MLVRLMTEGIISSNQHIPIGAQQVTWLLIPYNLSQVSQTNRKWFRRLELLHDAQVVGRIHNLLILHTWESKHA